MPMPLATKGFTMGGYLLFNGPGAGGYEKVIDFGNGVIDGVRGIDNIQVLREAKADVLMFLVTDDAIADAFDARIAVMDSILDEQWAVYLFRVTAQTEAQAAVLSVWRKLAGEPLAKLGEKAVTGRLSDRTVQRMYVGKSQWLDVIGQVQGANPDDYFDGGMKELVIYNEALTDAQMGVLARTLEASGRVPGCECDGPCAWFPAPKQGASVHAGVIAGAVVALVLLAAAAMGLAVWLQRRRRRGGGKGESGDTVGELPATAPVTTRRKYAPAAFTRAEAPTAPEVAALLTTYGSLPARTVTMVGHTVYHGVPRALHVHGDDDATVLATLATSHASSLGGDAPLLVLTAQLQYIISVLGGCFLQDFRLADMGPGWLKVGGQGAVAFATHLATGQQYAVKFYFSADAFRLEKAACCNKELHSAMPAVWDIIEHADALSTAEMPAPLSAHPLPPVIITEKGRSLEDYITADSLDIISTLQVMMQIAEKLAGMHAAGYAHRDLKPSNAIWLSTRHTWSLIDFGCTAAFGTDARIAFSLAYAAPEVICQWKSGAETMAVHPSADVWALGVMCFELLTRHRFFDDTAGSAAVIAVLAGERPLPTEGHLEPDFVAKLGNTAIRESLLSMLQRDPARRPSVRQVVATWKGLFLD